MGKQGPTTHNIGITEFRRRLAHWIGCVRYGDDFICIRRKGEDPVFLISKADFDLMEKTRIDYDAGPYDPVTKGRREGIMAWFRRKRRERDRAAEGLPEGERLSSAQMREIWDELE